jgi:hypothetical protein
MMQVPYTNCFLYRCSRAGISVTAEHFATSFDEEQEYSVAVSSEQRTLKVQ